MISGGGGRLALFFALALALTGGVGAFACSGFSSEESVTSDASVDATESTEDGMTDAGVSDAAVFSCAHVNAFRCADFEPTITLGDWSEVPSQNKGTLPEIVGEVWASPTHSARATTGAGAQFAGVSIASGTHWRLRAQVFFKASAPAVRPEDGLGIATELIRFEPSADAGLLLGTVSLTPSADAGELLSVSVKLGVATSPGNDFSIPLDRWLPLAFEVSLGQAKTVSFSIGDSAVTKVLTEWEPGASPRLFWGAFSTINVPGESTVVFYDDLTLEALP